MARYAYHGRYTDQQGNMVPSGTVKVFLAGTDTPASIYVASAGGTAVNSVSSSSTDGTFVFYVDDSDYATKQEFKIRLEATGYTAKEYDDIVITRYPRFKIGSFTHDLSSSGTQSITGVGFQPSSIILLASITIPGVVSVGMDDGTNHYVIMNDNPDATGKWLGNSNYSVYLLISAGAPDVGRAYIQSFDSDGFTVNWFPMSSPTGTATVFYLAMA
jgi:hypothetical protein